MGGGATSQENSEIANNQNYINTQGNALSDQAGDESTAYGDQAEGYENQADAAYAPALAGNGGYTPTEAAAIEDQPGLSNLYLTPAQQAAISGNPTAGDTSASELQSNYLTPAQEDAIMGDQTQVNQAISGLQAPVTTDANAANDYGGDVSTFANETELTPAEQEQMATTAARNTSAVDQSQIASNEEAARISGANPEGVWGETQQANQADQIAAANAASAAEVAANQEAAQRSQGILTAQQTALQAKQTTAAQEAAAAAGTLSAQQTEEGNESTRAAGIAANDQATSEENEGTTYTQAQAADTAASARAAGIAANDQSEGQYIDSADSARAGQVANQQQTSLTNAENYLTGEQTTNTNASMGEQGDQAGLYSTTTGASNSNTQNQVTADQKPAWWQSLISAGAQVGGAAAKAAAG